MSRKKRGSASTAATRSDGPATSAAATGDRRVWVFAGLDVAFATLYFALASIVQSADERFEAGTITLGIAMVVAAVGIGVRRPWGWWLSVAGCLLVLGGALLLMTLLATSAAFLWGTFGALGKGAASMCLIMLALVIEVYVILPAFQLGYLLSARGRRTAGRPAAPVEAVA